MQVLLYNIEKRKSIEIKNLCRKMNVGYTDVDKSDYGYRLGYLLNIDDNSVKAEGDDFSGEMMLLVDFNNGMMDLFLSLLRKKKCTVALKAVLTDTNKNFTSYELFSEISKEHEAMSRGESYHQA